MVFEEYSGMAMKNDFLIISVESRKGGVGKTTTALNLARIMLEKRKYAVLFLDADITGTNALDFWKSPFWKKTCHTVQNTTGDPPYSSNLLDLFERRFMTGLSIPGFFNIKITSNRQQDDESLIINSKKINIIGSQIYDLESSPKKNNDTLICKPSILFDELHAFWFIEFLQKLCEAFMETVRKDRADCPVAIIVDNSPGYVGIAPAVQEWLTDLGPDKGKFLIVSSPDIQDLSSCNNAINNLHWLYERKWKTSRKFVTAIRQEWYSGTEFRLNPEEERFFLRLVEAYPRRKSSDNLASDIGSINGIDLPFYLKENDEIGKTYLDQLEKYQGLVINRVPRLVKRGDYDYKMERMYTCKNRMYTNMDRKVIERLLGEKRGSYFDCMVTYEESIEYQFLQPMISRKADPVLQNGSHFKEFIHTIETSYLIPSDEEIQFMLLRGMTFSENMFEKIKNIREYLHEVHGKVKDVISLVEEYGFSYLTRLIHEEWLPINIMREFPFEMQDILSKIKKEIPFSEPRPWELSNKVINIEMREFINELAKNIKIQNDTENLSGINRTGEWFFPSLIVIVVLSLNQQWLHPDIKTDLQKIIIAIYNIEAKHWEQKSKQSKRKPSIQSFLAAERLKDSEWKDLKDELKIPPSWPEDVNFSHLYRACALAQARLIDVRNDVIFLIDLIKRLARIDISKTILLPYINGVAEGVIIRKTLFYNESRKKAIAEHLSKVNYMKEFSEVLEKILERWEIPS